MIQIPDVNVMVYAVDADSPSHHRCNTWSNQALNGESPIGFTWHALAGFVRIITNQRIVRQPRLVREAFDCIENWLAQKPSQVVHPGVNHLVTFRRIVESTGATANLISDANLAAIAIDYEAELVSCDADYAKFKGLRWFNPMTGKRINS